MKLSQSFGSIKSPVLDANFPNPSKVTISDCILTFSLLKASDSEKDIFIFALYPSELNNKLNLSILCSLPDTVPLIPSSDNIMVPFIPSSLQLANKIF